MTVIFCEKPSVAKDIAEVVKAAQKKEGYYSGNGYEVTWGYGHLVSLQKPSYYSEDPWNLVNLPIFPDPFELLIEKGKIAQFEIVKDLFNSADQIINAADAGREGELIFRYIYELSNQATKNVKRLWISSLTKKAISDGFKTLKDSKEYDNLFYSGRARNQADWLIGMNATIALTKIIKSNKPASLGRVQTPTFATVAKRYLDNKNFKPDKFYQPELILEKDNFKFSAKYPDKINTYEKAVSIVGRCNKEVICKTSESKESQEKQPLLFDLTSLQREANTRFHISAKQSLDIAQRLYEKHKAISYPRTDSRFISQDVVSTLPAIFKVLNKTEPYETFIKVIDLNNLPLNSVNSDKVTDHHALIPTDIVPKELSEDELKIYDLIVRQFIAAFSSPCLKSITTYTFENQHKDMFISSGTIILSKGWRAVISDKNKEVRLPDIFENESVRIDQINNPKRFTKAPALFTDASLLLFMETCGKTFEGEDIPVSIKEMGIGRPSTRASIIERIIEVGYIKRSKKYLVPTDNGIEIYNHIKDFSISNVSLTGNWEKLLNHIASGTVKEFDFIKGIKNYFEETLFPELKSLDGLLAPDTKVCPVCKNKSLFDYGKLLKCDHSKCEFIFWKTFLKKPFTDIEIKKILSMDKVLIKGLKNKENKSFSAYVFIDKTTNFKLSLEYKQKEAAKTTDIQCPKCGDGFITVNSKAYGCSNYKKTGCDFVIFKSISGKEISQETILKIIKEGASGPITGFISKHNKKFDAELKLNDQKKLEFVFN